ncbi:MAG TPA: TonB-dependent receptor [Thermoanaerobaculia bacterium]|nr:TonB-dependent receptor [Thermoanaerobaculia bacterium]
MIQPRRVFARLIFISLSLPLIGGALHGQETRDLSTLTVDDLMNVEVTSVARKGQKLSDTPAAVFVVTRDDIRRSGATSIPEILRIVPGLSVARINGNSWAISARGSNGQFANKLLVMIDGRTVYTPLFDGVFWDAQDTLLEDIDRIEVIRGPGGTLWGANAVNGIINIITMHAIETQGALVTAGAGAAEGSSAAGRFGGSFGHNGYYRAYGKTFDHPASDRGVDPTHDAWSMGRAGFRADWASRRGDNFTAQGDIYRGSAAALGVLIDPARPFADRATNTDLAGEDLQFRWSAIQSSRSDTTVQAYYDYTARTDTGLALSRRTFDVDFQHHLRLGRNDTVWGASYRTSDDPAAGPGFTLLRNSTVANLAGAFVQDEIEVTHRLHVTIGTKVQFDQVSNLQFQPTIRALFKVSDRQTVWAAVTSAVRTPAETELYGRLNVDAFPDASGNAGLIVVNGNTRLRPERVESYEAGYRWQVSLTIDLDATVFHNHMHDLLGTEVNAPFVDSSGRTIIPINISNEDQGNTHGGELLLTDAVTSNWNVAFGYSFFEMTTVSDEGLITTSKNSGTDPRHQLQLRSFMQLPRQLELDTSAYYAGRIANDVPSYLRLDAQLSWRPARRWELSISGQNLLHARHAEFAPVNGQSESITLAQRTVNGKVTWRF